MLTVAVVVWLVLLVPIWYLLAIFLSYVLPLDEYIFWHDMPVPAVPLITAYYRAFIRPLSEHVLQIKVER